MAPSPPHPPAPLAVRETTSRLQPSLAAGGINLTWSVPEAVAPGTQVQVWRSDGGGWSLLAVGDAEGRAFDPEGQADTLYRLTWSEGRLPLAALVSLPFHAEWAGGGPGAGLSADEGASRMAARILATVLWGSAFLVGMVQTAGPGRRVPPDPPEEDLLADLLSGHPGVDGRLVERLAGLGVRTVGQFQALDPDAIAFWSGLPVQALREWRALVLLLRWPRIPQPARHHLAAIGIRSLGQLADANPAAVAERLAGSAWSAAAVGTSELETWIGEAKGAFDPFRSPDDATPARGAEGPKHAEGEPTALLELALETARVPLARPSPARGALGHGARVPSS